MQLISKILFILFSLFLSLSLAQESNNTDNPEVDFLVGYYEQDGNNAAVTGGIGSQKLDDIATQIIVNVPFRNGNKLSINGGFDTYSSASSDMIDPVRTGASGSDIRVHINGAYTFVNDESNSQFGVNLGFSNEFDYRSISFGGNWAKSTEDGNSEINLAGQFFYDLITLIEPIELRDQPRQLGEDDWNYKDDNRLTYSVSATLSQVITKRLQASINLDFVYQSGYLATSFHRVYFPNESLARIESLPDSRYKIPIGLRINYAVSDLLITRFDYRYYHDDFGIDANTFNLELPLKITDEFTLSPFYRYHTQTASDYFVPYNEANPSSEFYTSDYDLADFNSQKYGVGLRYYPLLGLVDFSPPFATNFWTLKNVNLRVGYYKRSTGLDALTASLGFSFVVR